MNSTGQSQFLQVLRDRRDAIADRWVKALARTDYAPFSVMEVRQCLLEGTQEAIELLFTEPFDQGRAEAIGASLARLHYIGPEALWRTQEVLGPQLVEGLPAEEVVELQPRLAAVLGGVAAGFFRQARETTLEEQEGVREALVWELRRMGEALRKAHDELDIRVQERTAELARANEALRAEIAERVRAEEGIKQRNRELAALNAIAARVNRSLDLDRVLNEALDRGLETMGLEVGAIHLLNEQNGTLDLKAHRGVDLSPQILERISRAKLTEGPLAEAIASGEPLIIEDLSAYPVVEMMGRGDLKSLAIIRLESKGRVMGTMEVVSSEARQFTSEEMGLLTSIGHQIGVAMENAGLYGDLERRLEQLSALADLSTAISSTLDLDEILKTVVERIAQAMKARMCSIRLVEGDHLDFGVGVGYQDEVARQRPLLIDEQLVRLVWDGQPLLIPDIEAGVEIPASLRERMRREGVRAYLGVPMMTRGRGTGIVSIYQEEPHAWTDEEVDFASTIASHAATAVEKARLHQAVLEERGRIQAMLSSITEGLYVTDPQGTIVAFNAGAERITGWRAQQIVGQSCCELFNSMEGETWGLCGPGECLVQQVVQTGRPCSFWDGGKQVLTREGSRVPVAVTVSPLLDGEEASGTVVAFWDISQQAEVERLQEEFLSLVSHTLRAPLTNIKAAAQLLLGDQGTLDAGMRGKILSSVARECDRLDRWVRRILDVTRLEAGQMGMTKTPVALLPLVESALYLHEGKSPLHYFEVWAPEGDLWVLGDEEQILAILNELLDNAVKYSPEGGRIRIEIEEQGEGSLAVSVSDEGCGIPPQDLDRVFQKFYRVEKGDTQKVPGSGLGLYMAKRLIAAHEGEIWVESQEGHGSRFVFTLPRV